MFYSTFPQGRSRVDLARWAADLMQQWGLTREYDFHLIVWDHESPRPIVRLFYSIDLNRRRARLRTRAVAAGRDEGAWPYSSSASRARGAATIKNFQKKFVEPGRVPAAPAGGRWLRTMRPPLPEGLAPRGPRPGRDAPRGGRVARPGGRRGGRVRGAKVRPDNASSAVSPLESIEPS
jgi:hypothetical protein